MSFPRKRNELSQRSPDLLKYFNGKMEEYLTDVHGAESDGWHVVMFAPRLHPHLVVNFP
jgi:hypothetical protein